VILSEYERMQQAILMRAYQRGELELLATRADPIDVDDELGRMPAEDAAAIRSGEAPIPSPSDLTHISRLFDCFRRAQRLASNDSAHDTSFGKHHKQVSIKHGHREAEIDAAIAPLLLELWKAGIETVQSCECHAATGKIWIEFRSAEDAERFLDVVARRQTSPESIYQRTSHWHFGMYESFSWSRNLRINPREERERLAWEFQVRSEDSTLGGEEDTYEWPTFRLHTSVLFPRDDVEAVLDRMQEHNGTGTA
jgi:hypothetical protein